MQASGPWRITILMDSPSSWIVPFGERLKCELLELGHYVRTIQQADELESGDIAFFLGCQKIIPKSKLKLHAHNLVVHESALPKGRGWSPLTWQILEGASHIPVTLFEAAETVDSGVVYFQETLSFEGHELVDELREKQGEATIELAKKFVKAYPDVVGIDQQGEPTYYPRRTPRDSELDPTSTLVQLFGQLRVVDNARYPAFFRYRGHTYVLTITKQN